MEKISNKVKWSFAIGGLGKDAMFAMSTIMLFYFNVYLGISSAFLGVMMMIVRAWDAVNDPMMGTVVEKTKTRWGKFRPWILIGAILNGIVLVLMFANPDFQNNTTLKLVYVTSIYTLWGMTYTLMDIPFWSMIPTLSSKQKEREDVTVLTRLMTTLGYFIIAGGFYIIAGALGGATDTTTDIPAMLDGAFYLSIIVAVVFIITEFVTVRNVKEAIAVDEEKKTLKEMVRLLRENDQLLVVMIVVLVINFTLYITSGMAIYYITYSIGNQDLYLPFIAVGGVGQILGTVLFTPLRNKFKRKSIYNIAILAQLAAFVLLFVNAFFLSSNVILLFVFALPIFIGQGVFMVLQTVLLSDTVEYGQLKLGNRSEAIAFSVQTFVVKLAMGLSLGVIGVGLAVIGFKQPLVHSQANIEIFEQSAATLQGMNYIMFILPIFGLLIGRYIFNKKHIIDEEKYQEIVAELNKRGELNGENSN